MISITGAPDYVELVAQTANMMGSMPVLVFIPALRDEVGLNDLGGTSAFDVYLVDFGGNSDGMFGIDGCEERLRGHIDELTSGVWILHWKKPQMCW